MHKDLLCKPVIIPPSAALEWRETFPQMIFCPCLYPPVCEAFSQSQLGTLTLCPLLWCPTLLSPAALGLLCCQIWHSCSCLLEVQGFVRMGSCRESVQQIGFLPDRRNNIKQSVKQVCWVLLLTTVRKLNSCKSHSFSLMSYKPALLPEDIRTFPPPSPLQED